MKTNTKFTTAYMARVAVLAAIASVLFYFPEIPIIPFVPFYKLDFSMLPALLGGFALGPAAGVLITLIKDLTGMLHTTSSFVGELADFMMSVAFILPASIIYTRRRTRKAAVLGMLVGLVAICIVGAMTNLYLLIPLFVGDNVQVIINMVSPHIGFVDSLGKFILAITVPFNLIKGLVIGVLTYFMYKPLRPLLKGRE